MKMSAFEKVLVKYDWAQKHIRDLEAATDTFRESYTDLLGSEVNNDSGEVTYFVKEVPSIDHELALRFGDCVHNLRSTLDYLAHALVLAAGGTPDKYTAFPVFDDAKGYVSLSRTKVVGLGQECLRVLDAIQPYKGGWGETIWQLHRLDIVDKHRLLLTICSMNTGRTATPSEVSLLRLKNRSIARMDNAILPIAWLGANTTNGFIPLHAGYKLLTVPADEAKQKVGFAFDIAINESAVLVGAPMYLFLKTASRQVLNIINNFGPHL